MDIDYPDHPDHPNNLDIDAEDAVCPEFVSEYAVEIHQYLFSLEDVYTPTGKLPVGITAEMRATLVDWLTEVNREYDQKQDTLFFAANYLDRYLARTSVTKLRLQLVGIVALMLASKFEETYGLDLGDCVHVTDGAYTDQEVAEMERHMLSVLQWKVAPPIPLHFLRRASKSARASPETHTLAKYFLELGLCHHPCTPVRASLRAAAALWLARLLMNEGPWDHVVSHHSRYTPNELRDTVCALAEVRVHRVRAPIEE